MQRSQYQRNPVLTELANRYKRDMASMEARIEGWKAILEDLPAFKDEPTVAEETMFDLVVETVSYLLALHGHQPGKQGILKREMDGEFLPSIPKLDPAAWLDAQGNKLTYKEREAILTAASLAWAFEVNLVPEELAPIFEHPNFGLRWQIKYHELVVSLLFNCDLESFWQTRRPKLDREGIVQKWKLEDTLFTEGQVKEFLKKPKG